MTNGRVRPARSGNRTVSHVSPVMPGPACRSHSVSRSLSRSLALTLSVTTALVPVSAWAGEPLPTGGAFISGTGAISQSGTGMDIHQSSASGIITWNGFGIGAGNQVHFNNGSGATLNRVTGNVASQIDGSLTATGSVFLINPAGVVVGTGGMVATGGSFVASTQDLTDADFQDGGAMTFSGTSRAGVTNAGTIRSAQGDIALIARRVENSGTLEAPNGTAGLAAGYEVLMKDGADADGLLSVQVGGEDTEAVNSGTIAAANAEIRANGGNVYALAGNTDGVVKATGVSRSGGRIFLTAGETGKVQVTGKLKARTVAADVPVPGSKPATEGGSITITGGDINISGTVDASAESGAGGTIVTTGKDIMLADGALLDASGATGGLVLVGGDFQGGYNAATKYLEEDVATAETVTGATDATIRVDGTAGEGGRAVVWSDDTTIFDGTITATGAGTAAGGQVETSGHNLVLGDNVSISTLSEQGATGTWLIDPYNVTISTSSSNNASVNVVGNPWVVAPNASGANLNNTTLNSYLSSNNVTITTNGAGVEAGNITVSAAVSWTAATTLTLQADASTGGIFINAAITGSNASSVLNLSAGSGDINQTAPITAGTLTATTANGGHVTLTNSSNAVSTLGASSSAGAFQFYNSQALTVTGPFSSGGSVELIVDSGDSSGDLTIDTELTGTGTNAYYSLQSSGDLNINKSVSLSGDSAFLVLDYGGSSDYTLGSGARITLSGSAPTLVIDGNTYTLIHDASDLQTISGSGFYALAETVDASETATWNSGAGFETIGGFSGTLAGLGNTVDGLTINRPGETSVGLFSSTNGTFRDFTLSNVSVTSGGSAGALAYRIEAGQGISNVHVTGTVTSLGPGGQVGGLVGWSDQITISNSSSAVTVTGFGETGGLVGRLRAGTIINSYATGAVTGTSSYVGGLVGGTFQGGTLTNVYASGLVTGTSAVGGLVGGAVFAGAVTATNAYWDADSTRQSSSYAGTSILNQDAYDQTTYSGFDFTNTWVMIDGETRPMLRNEYSDKIFTAHQLQLMSLDTTASYTLGTNIDMTSAFTANVNGFYGDVWSASGFDPIASFSGSLDGQSHTITGLTIDRSGDSQTGLIKLLSGTISDIGLVGGSVAGGTQSGTLVGYVDTSGVITRSFSSADMSANGNFVGGLVGANAGQISLSYATGDVISSASSVGGFVGVNDGTISNSFATGSVSATTYAGGFAGGNRSVLTSVYATGRVLGSGTNGGLTPYNTGTITTSYWDTQTSGTTSGWGTSQTTAQLQGTLPTGFSSAIWGTGAGLYPYFKWQYASTPVAVSGLAYDNSGSVLAGVDVSALSAGSLLGTSTSGANGYYYILSEAGSIDATGALAYLNDGATDGAALKDTVASTGITGLDVYGSKLNLITEETSLSATQTNLSTALGSYSDTDLDFITTSASTIQTSSGYDLVLGTASNYALDIATLYSGADLSLTSGGTFSLTSNVSLQGDGDLDLNSPFAWSGSSSLSVTNAGSGTTTFGGSITAADGGLYISGVSGTATTASAVSLGSFGLSSGTWSQIAGTLPSFSVTNFQLAETATFLRVTGGDGSSSTPYQIADAYGLQGIGGDSMRTLSFVLANDIDASGTSAWNSGAGFAPIGSSVGSGFTGSLDGEGHTISGLTINRAVTQYVGLVGVAGSGAVITDLTLNGSSITGNQYVGALAGYALSGSAFSDVVLTGGSVSGASYVGGLAGQASAGSTITNATSSTNVTGSNTAIGGIAGVLAGAMSGTSSSGTVTGTGAVTFIGGLAGLVMAGGTIDLAYATGDITAGGTTASGGSAGGLAGGNFGSITRSFATGDVTIGSRNAGGLVGLNSGSVTNSYATGHVDASTLAGGLIGLETTSGSVSNAYATGTVTTDDSTEGGIVGLADSGAGSTFSNVFWNTETSGLTNAGGSVSGAAVGATGLDTEGMMTLSSFTGAGWDIDDEGGTGSIWRIYEGSTNPLLRGFMTSLTVTGGTGTKTYDGSTSSSSTGTLVYGASYDNSLISGTARYVSSSKNAGSYTGSNLTLTGLYSSQLGYDLAFSSGSLTISKKSLSVTATANNKVYDGTTSTTGSFGAFSGLISGDVVSIASGSAFAFLTDGAGTGKAVNVTGIGLSGTDAGNYTIASTASATAAITQKTLTVSAIADNKVYDGTTSATGSFGSLSGLISGDLVSLDGSALFAFLTDGAGAGKAVNVTGIGLSGADAGNYTIASTASTTATITPKTLTISASANDKVYDGTTSATGSFGSLSGLISGDLVSLDGSALFAFLTDGAGAGKAVNVTGIGLTGADAGNYTIASTASTTATITRKTLTVSASADDKIYDGTTSATGSFSGFSGLISGDVVSLDGSALFAFADKN
ncbi:YDG domain-containing protein, partial [Roseibium suaedae]